SRARNYGRGDSAWLMHDRHDAPPPELRLRGLEGWRNNRRPSFASEVTGPIGLFDGYAALQNQLDGLRGDGFHARAKRHISDLGFRRLLGGSSHFASHFQKFVNSDSTGSAGEVALWTAGTPPQSGGVCRADAKQFQIDRSRILRLRARHAVRANQALSD